MIELLILLAIVGLIAWAIITLVPMPPAMRTVIIAAAVLICLLILVRALGVDVGVPRLSNT